MSWREFTLRRIGHERQQKEKWYHTRTLAYFQLTAVGAFKGTMEEFMPLDGPGRPKQLSEAQKAALMAANEEFIRTQNE